MKKIWQFSLPLLLVFSFTGKAQTIDSLKIDFSGFIESYYVYDFNQPSENQKIPFLYNYNRHNEFNINNALLRVKANYENVYASFALHSGTYVEDNYAAEDIKFISEAIVGIYLDDKRKHAIEMGIMPSYIGFETATSSSNLTLTRSMLAENSPYFITGIKYQFQPSEKWTFTTLLTNGWQRISKLEKSALPAFGSQITFKPIENATFNWSTFIGDEPTEFGLKTRYFSNLYFDYQWNGSWRTIAGFDVGVQKSSIGENYENWFSPVFIAQYSFNSKWQTAFRTEYYQDENNVIINVNDMAFKTFGNSLNVDFLPTKNVKIRMEARWLKSEESIFLKNNQIVDNNFFITTSMCFEF
ncbi:outer membrane beta-barrel protein [Flavobacterium sp. UBA6135]|uniref:outer membrane beta-barrel protein n=1 Tax=Flavobacterium sp. UBA6135 TaxID=1946553 RepID=UPI0025C074B2|nr:outer membrane beta-barrel protein [Flavobacterium sp. UBA6135]